jgi:hypothetical protein
MATRLESIRALEKLQTLDEKAEKALIDDITGSTFTTAYISARILGNHKCTAAIPLLRELAASTDYMLAGEAIIALAKMQDETFRPEIENIILNTNNPRLKIMGAEALGLYRCTDSIPVLLDMLLEKDQPPHLNEEIVLAIASILNTQRMFYPVLVRFAANNSLTIPLGLDEAEAALEFYNSATGGRRKSKEKSTAINFHAENFLTAVSDYIKDNNGEKLSKWISELPESQTEKENTVKSVLSQTVLNKDLCVHNSLRLLIIQWASYKLRLLAA